MASTVEISIPSTQISTGPKPYTEYNISLRLPLRSFTVTKRYSEFTTLHSNLTSEASAAPPASLPPKSYFSLSSTTHNPARTEARRQGLEAYLQAINTNPDPRWRDTSAWRSFLNLPRTASSKSSIASDLRSTISANGGVLTDPVVWLDCHRDLKSKLHEARLHITQRDQAATTQAQHEEGAQAKKCLVKAGTMIASLAQGLSAARDEWGSDRLGEGEVRRRRDLVASARKEKEGLENLLTAMVAKASVDATVADKSKLISSNHEGGVARQGRVLGKETARTRELDNSGVLGLQKQMMAEQDEDVMVLAQAVRRQKELGIEIQKELEVQKDILEMLDEDVTRVDGKVRVARKRVDKIS